MGVETSNMLLYVSNTTLPVGVELFRVGYVVFILNTAHYDQI